MQKLKLLAGAALGAALIWCLLPASTPVAVTQGEGQGVPRVSAAQIPAPNGESASVSSDAATAPSVPIKVQVPAAKSASTPSTGNARATLTRELEQVQRVQMAGREWSVLGTKDVVNDLGKQVVLVLRDEISGQLDYRKRPPSTVIAPA